MIEAPKPIHFLVLDCRVDVKSGGRANARAVGGLKLQVWFRREPVACVGVYKDFHGLRGSRNRA